MNVLADNDAMNTPSSSPSQANSAYERQRHRITQTLSEFTLPLLCDIYRHFEGDMIAAIVLGEIGVRNVGSWLSTVENDAKALEDPSRHGEVLRPCNALSIAESTGIPRETVRRRVDALIARGWVYRNSAGHLFVQAGLAYRFDDLTDSTQQRLRATAAKLEALLRDTAANT